MRTGVTLSIFILSLSLIFAATSTSVPSIISQQLGVAVSISPTYQGGVPGATLVYIITVKNTGDLMDSYTLTVGDNSGWGLTLSENTLTIPAGENRTVTLSVAIPFGEVCTFDNILVTAPSMADNAVMDTDECFAHLGRAKLGLYIKWCYGFMLGTDLSLYLREDSRNLVLKFYTYGYVYEGENIIWSGATPEHVVFSEVVPHPTKPREKPERVRVVLTDEENNEVQTISSFVTTRSALMSALLDFYMRWPYVNVENRVCIMCMIVEIFMNWPYAPPT